jgi:uncharacterized protein (DUF983 family)
LNNLLIVKDIENIEKTQTIAFILEIVVGIAIAVASLVRLPLWSHFKTPVAGRLLAASRSLSSFQMS